MKKNYVRLVLAFLTVVVLPPFANGQEVDSIRFNSDRSISISPSLDINEIDTVFLDEEISVSPKKEKKIQDLGKFNYKYIRFAYLQPQGIFGNPFTSSANYFVFENRQNANYKLNLGLESGNVRHFLSLGTEMVRLGINSGLGIMAFGPAEEEFEEYRIQSNGTYLVRLGLGPQITFKPMASLRVGTYYRLGIALLYSTYLNERYIGEDIHRIETQIAKYAYNGDFGVDLSWEKISIGFAVSHLSTRLSKANVVDFKDLINEDLNSYITESYFDEEYEDGVPLDPLTPLKFNRISISIGFAL